jgi:hypothetical protein
VNDSKIIAYPNLNPRDDHRFNWEAHFDGVPNSQKGYGKSEQEAINDLLSRKVRPPPPGS